MPGKSIWKGHVKLSLVAFPVAAYSAAISGSEIHFNQLHKDCGSRIRYKKTCPMHGEVQADEIVSGYEHAKGEYVVIDPTELDKLRTPDEKMIRFDAFIHLEQLDPMYLAGSTYYLLPEGPAGVNAYAVVQDAMKETGLVGLAQVVFHGREQLVMVRPVGRLLAITSLHLDPEINKPTAFEEQVPDVQPTPEEVGMGRTLIRSSSAEKSDFAKYRDRYTDRLREVIEAKVAGQAIVAPPVMESAPVIGLMEALKRSVAAAEANGSQRRPVKKMAESVGKKAKAKKKQA